MKRTRFHAAVMIAVVLQVVGIFFAASASATTPPGYCEQWEDGDSYIDSDGKKWDCKCVFRHEGGLLCIWVRQAITPEVPRPVDILPLVNVADPERCRAVFAVTVNHDPLRQTTLRMYFGHADYVLGSGPSYEDVILTADTGSSVLYFEHIFPYEPLQTFTQTAVVIETGESDTSTTTHL